MSSLVYFKFKANVKTDSIPFDGSSISVKDLKAAIRTKCCLYSSDFDLKLEDTNGKSYTKDDELIPKYTSIVVRRVPRITPEGPKRKINTPDDVPWKDSQRNVNIATSQSQKLMNLAESDLSEEEKIKIMMERSSEAYSEKHFIVKAKPYGIPPAAYVCHKCGLPGHWIHNCPGVRDQTGKIMDVKSVKRPTGIPQDFLLEVEAGTPGAYLGKSGKYMVPIKDAEAYAQGKKDKRPFSVEENPPYVPTERVPPKQFICPLCSNMFRDAVLVSCCGTTYCNECIMGHVFDSQVLGSHTCPNCGAALSDHESSVFENALVRSMIRDWLANEPQLPEPETELTKPSIFNVTEDRKCFINNRRVLKPKQSTTSNMEVKHDAENTKPSETENKHATPPMCETSGDSNASTNAYCTSPIDSKDIFEPAISVSAVVPSNTCSAVVASAPCTTIMGSGREALLASSDFPIPSFPRVSYSSSTVIPTILPSINGGGNPLLTALYNMRVDGLQPSVGTQQVVLPGSFQGSLISGTDWATNGALAVSQSTSLVDPLVQIDNTQNAYGLVTGQNLPGTFSTAPIQAIDGHKVLSKEEFYRLKMEVLDSARRRHRHRSRSRSPYRSRHRRTRDDERTYTPGFRAPRHSSDEFDSDYNRRHHRPVDYYESNRDSRNYSSRHHFDGTRYLDSYGYHERERFLKSNDLRATLQNRKRDERRRSGSKSRSSERQRSRERRLREPHTEQRDDQSDASRNPDNLSPASRSGPLSIVPQYDFSEPESTESKSRRQGNSEDVLDRHVLRTCDAYSDSSHSKTDAPHSRDTEYIERIDMNNEGENSQSSKKRGKKEKKHKKHKHRHSEKKKQKKLQRAIEALEAQSHSWALNTLDANPSHDETLSKDLATTEKKHKRHKKHKHEDKEKKEKHSKSKKVSSVGASEES